MDANQYRHDHGRAARAADLVAALADKLPLGHPARPIVRELQQLYGVPLEQVRELLDRVPGESLTAKAAAIGVTKQVLWNLWNGRYRPTPTMRAKIEAAAKGASDGA